ncbi:uncharacterized protein LOC122393822 [Amphibalanus amphitrite]|uniref:uncharacterized protein LOC122393822 n=1 Tax=Amphibalanus amphitrite TaxID=1232801 RepID=UPI001C9070FB|nr:uncharacterized protein LOC122393822 [Amphibalanus amphitrite]
MLVLHYLAVVNNLSPRVSARGASYLSEVVVDVSALTRGVRLLSVEVPLTAVPAGPAASPAADIERGTCPPPFGPLQLLQSAAQLSVSVSLAVPLDLLPRPAPARCAYGRLLAVVSQRGLQRSGVMQLIQQLNEPPSPAAAEGAAPRRPGDVSTPGISGFCLADRQLHLLFAEGRADAELEQTAGLLFRERLYPRQPAAFRVLEDRPLRAQLLDTRLYTLQKQEPARAVRAIRECFRTQWLSENEPASQRGRPATTAGRLLAEKNAFNRMSVVKSTRINAFTRMGLRKAVELQIYNGTVFDPFGMHWYHMISHSQTISCEDPDP